MVIQNYYRTTILSLGVMLGVTAMVGGILASNRVLAEDDTSVVDQINITVPVSCTISGTGMNTHNANINNGLYVPDIGTTTLHAFCNDNEGFAIYAAGYTGNEIGGTNSNKLVGTNASSNATIESGIATTAGNPDISNWAMKLAISQDSGDTTGTNAFTIDNGFNSYHIVPNEYVKVAHKNSNTDMTASTGGVKLTTTYAAYISKTQPADTYTGQVVYTLLHPAPAPLTCNPSGTTISTIVCMQDINSTNMFSIMASMTQDIAYLLYDSRDEQQYHVAKLADDNIWMLDNLALDPTDPATAANMNASNTNASAEAITNLLNGGNIDDNEGWSSVAVADVDTGFNSDTAPMINNASKDTLVTSYGAAATNGQAKVGIYYNYCAASAGTYCPYDSNYGGSYGSGDICPAHWRMPTWGDYDESISDGGEYYELGIALGLTFDEDDLAFNGNTYQTALSLPLSGYYYNNSTSAQGNEGYWWPSHPSYDYGTYTPYVYAQSSYMAIPYYGSERGYGYSMRCLVGV